MVPKLSGQSSEIHPLYDIAKTFSNESLFDVSLVFDTQIHKIESKTQRSSFGPYPLLGIMDGYGVPLLR